MATEIVAMTNAERYADIAKRSGYSEDTVKTILRSARQSIIDSLLAGERATLPGIGTATPVVVYLKDIPELSVARVRWKMSTTIEKGVANAVDIKTFKMKEKEIANNVLLERLPALSE